MVLALYYVRERRWSLFDDHIGPRFLPLSTDSEGILSQYWCQGFILVAGTKVAEREEYVKQLQVPFDERTGLSTREGLVAKSVLW